MLSNYGSLKAFLNDFPFLTEDDCLFFEPFLRSRRFLAKEFLLSEGSVCHFIGFISKGSFRTYYLVDGKEINIHFAFEKEFITDYQSFLESIPSNYYIQAMRDSEIVIFDFAALQSAYQQSHNWERFGRIIAEQSYLLTTKRVESFLFFNAEQRYLNLLKTQPHIFEQVPLYHIASYLGIERETLSRLRRIILRK